MRFETSEALNKFRTELLEKKQSEENGRKVVILPTGTCGLAHGAQGVIDEFKKLVDEMGVADKVVLRITGCVGFCEVEPIVIIDPDGIFYQRVKPSDVKDILEKTILNGEIVERLTHKDPQTGSSIPYQKDIPFYRKQLKLVSGNNKYINPFSIDDYIAIGGYSSLQKALFGMGPDSVIDEVTSSGLRGRGGGGFPTGVKWKSARKADGDIKYVLCNADEGDPGAYMDRNVLEGNPHSVIEGMIIGAYAIGAGHGFIYVRHEYPLARETLEKAIADAHEYGLLGKNILGSGFDFDISINQGGGAFVCGESSALIASLEGKVGEPRAKYIHMAESGLWGKPTVLNNVETWANVPLIIGKGAKWYTEIGPGDVSENPWGGNKGTKIFSLVGKVRNSGLVEVPMGITLKEIVFDIGGGILGNRKLKAVQTGGPSGGVIPEKYLDVSVDFDTLTELGSMMGSGGMIVMDENTCMVDVAKYFIDFLKDESCGKCTPCREGLRQMHEILTRITEGRGKMEDLDTLEELGSFMKDASLCALGQSAPNPVLSTLKYFRDEYVAHIQDKKCPAGVCKDLITYDIIPDKCTGCLACKMVCPSGAISGEKNKVHVIDQSKCIKCGACMEVCRYDAVIKG